MSIGLHAVHDIGRFGMKQWIFSSRDHMSSFFCIVWYFFANACYFPAFHRDLRPKNIKLPEITGNCGRLWIYHSCTIMLLRTPDYEPESPPHYYTLPELLQATTEEIDSILTDFSLQCFTVRSGTLWQTMTATWKRPYVSCFLITTPTRMLSIILMTHVYGATWRKMCLAVLH